MSFNCENSKESSDNELIKSTDLIIVNDSTKRKCSEQFFSLKRTKKEDEIKQKSAGRPSSSVRSYFEKINEKDSRCKIDKNCKPIKSACFTNEKNHLEKYHSDLYEKIKKEETKKVIDSKQQSISGFFDQKLTKYKPNDPRQIQLEKHFSFFFAATKYPFNLIYNQLFRNLIHCLNGRFNIPGLVKVNNYAIEFNCQMKDKIKKLLKEANFLTLSTDIWTSKNMEHSYLALNCHFYDKKLESNQTLLIALELLEEKHTGYVIKEAIEKIIKSYDINYSKILRLISDDGSNLVKSFKSLIY